MTGTTRLLAAPVRFTLPVIQFGREAVKALTLRPHQSVQTGRDTLTKYHLREPLRTIKQEHAKRLASRQADRDHLMLAEAYRGHTDKPHVVSAACLMTGVFPITEQKPKSGILHFYFDNFHEDEHSCSLIDTFASITFLLTKASRETETL